MSLVARKLIAKELYLNRWFIAGGTISGIGSVLIATLGRAGFNVGSLMWLTSIIAMGVMLAIYGVSNERKEQSLQFVLSLPVSTGEYVRAKLAGLLLCYLIPWLISGAAAVVLVIVSAVPDGMLPYTILLCVFLLTNFALVLSGVLLAKTESVVAGSIVVTNMFVSLYMFVVGAVPGLGDHMQDAVPVWNRTVFTILGIELFVLVVALLLPLLVAARRRDFL